MLTSISSAKEQPSEMDILRAQEQAMMQNYSIAPSEDKAISTGNEFLKQRATVRKIQNFIKNEDGSEMTSDSSSYSGKLNEDGTSSANDDSVSNGNVNENEASVTDDNKAILQTMRQEFAMEIKEKRAQFASAISATKEEAAVIRERKREELQTKLQNIKDEKKQQIITRIDENMNSLNERITSNFATAIEKMEVILANIATRADKVSITGANTSEIRAKIQTVTDLISSAREALRIQTGKTYGITIESEDTAKSNIQVVKNQLVDDLQKIRESIQTIKQAIKEIADELATIPNINEY